MWVLSVALLFAVTTAFIPPGKEKIKWVTVAELNVLYAKEPRPILIDVYTDWCGWCKEMDRTTYRNEKLAKYINEHYYAVRYNAESRDSVFFNNTVFRFNKKMETNDFAMYLTFGRLEYPCTVFLSSLDARPAPLAGYMKPREMEGPLKFFGERADVRQTFVEFDKQLKKEW
jgi:uncharacterized protein YyaL (SSP411 family)